MGLLNVLLSDKKNSPKKPTVPIAIDICGNIFSVALPTEAEIGILKTQKLFSQDTSGDIAETLLEARIKYPGKVFFQPRYGDLIVSAEILFEHGNRNLFHQDEMQDFIIGHCRSKYEQHNALERESVTIAGHIPTDTFYYYPEEPSSFYLKEVNNTKLTSYNIVGKETHNYYSCPITDKSILTLGFRFNHAQSRGAWELMELAGAQADAERVLKTLKIEYAQPLLR